MGKTGSVLVSYKQKFAIWQTRLSTATKVSGFGAGQASDAQPRLKAPDPVPGHGQLGVPRVLERDRHLAGKPGIYFLDPVHIDQHRPMNAQETSRVEPVLELGDRLVHAVLAAIGDGIRQLVQRLEMRHRFEIEESDAFPHPRGDSAGKLMALPAQRCGQLVEKLLKRTRDR